MRKAIILAAITGGVLAGGVAAWSPVAGAQTAPPAPPPPADGGMHRPGDGRPMGGGMDRMGDERYGGGMRHDDMMQRMRQFALIYPARDKMLSGPDVQKIAEAFLLINGNHTWKITEVQEQPDVVTFALATPDGTAIARFEMDRHSARPRRIS